MLDKDFKTELIIARRRNRWKAKEEELRAETRNGKSGNQEEPAEMSLQVSFIKTYINVIYVLIIT